MAENALQGRWLPAWGRWVARWRWFVLVGWTIVLALAGQGARQLEHVLQGGTGRIAGSSSAAAEARLHEGFANPFVQSLVLVTESSATVDDPTYARFLKTAASELRAEPGVVRVASYLDSPDARLVSDDRHRAIVLVGLGAAEIRVAEQLVPRLRERIRKLNPQGIRCYLTGRGALTHDINSYSTEDLGRAEARGFPLTLAVLVLAFGSLVAALLPLYAGVASIILTLGLLYQLSAATELSTLAQSVCSMLGLAMGIDYALLIVGRFRVELKRGIGPVEALAATLASAGSAVLVSGLTVAIGFAGLLLTGVLDTRSMGLGGLVVAACSVLVALTLLPALLAILGPHVDSPRWLRLPKLVGKPAVWAAWLERVMARPWLAIVASLAVLLALASPLLGLEAGFPTGRWLPESLEYQRGFDALVAMERGGLAAPVDVVLTPLDGGHALALKHIPALIAYSRKLHADPRVASVLSPVDLTPPLSPAALLLLYANPEAALQRYPALAELFVSRDRRTTYFQVFLRDGVGFEESKRFSSEQGREPPRGYEVLVGGQGAFYVEFDRSLGEAVPLVLGFVMLATLGVMAIAFRSAVVPIKALFLNALSVGAGLGVVVAVFQLGWGGALFGVGRPLEQIPLTVSLTLFCVVFGLSMDYEVFLLSRIKEHYDAGADNHTATVQGIAATAGVITSAAAIMVCIFGAFAWAEFAVVQMLGLGLAVAVAVDATLVRLVLLPALMRLAGDWNWWAPGYHSQARWIAAKPSEESP